MAQPARKISTIVEKNKFTGESSIVTTAVNKLVDFVKPTLGPKIRHILVDSGYKVEQMDDGVSIAQEFELEDEFENAVISFVKEASKKTDDLAGDGTTTTMVILQALLNKLDESGLSYPVVRRELEKAVEEAMAQLKEMATIVQSEDDLYKVAKTAMDDEEAAKIVSDVVWKIGAKGAVTIADSVKRGISYEKVEGFVMGRGYIARGMITNRKKQTYEAPNNNFPGEVSVFHVEQTVASQDDIVSILKEAESRGTKNIVLFCNNLIGEALGIVALNQIKGAFNIVAVSLPGQGDKAKDYIEDLKIVVGEPGIADKVIVTSEDTTIIGGHGEPLLIEQAVKRLQERVDETKDDYEKDYLHARQARLQQGIVVISVGCQTDSETRLKIKKIEDAINACKCALEDGICPGAGMTLKRLKTSSESLNFALGEVSRVVLENAEMTEPPSEAQEGVYTLADHKATFNVLDATVGHFLEVGVVDAVKVLRTAIENAVSIAKTLFTTRGIITSERPRYDSEKS